MSLLDKVLEIGSTPDWISPLKGMVDDFQHGGGDRIKFHRSISVNEAKKRLRKAEIECWNDFIDGDYGWVSVPYGEGDKARRIISEGYYVSYQNLKELKMGIFDSLFGIKEDDSIYDKILKVGGSFDYITPALDLINGYNTIECEGWVDHCKQVEKQLKKQGIKCRTHFTGDSWQVLSKR